MSASTTRLALYKPGGGLTGAILPDEVADIDKINGNMDLIDAAIGLYICTSTTRPASPYNGQPIYETDTKNQMYWSQSASRWVPIGIPNAADAAARSALYPAPAVGDLAKLTTELWPRRYNGTDWKPYGSGLFPIKPVSVGGTGVSLDAEGKISLSNATQANINNCFSSDFDAYEIRFNLPTISAANTMIIRLRAAGVDLSTTYVFGINWNNSSTPSSSVGPSSGAYITYQTGGSISSSGKVVLYDPYSAVPKRMFSTASNGGTNDISMSTIGSYISSASSYDGFTLLSSTGTSSFSGSIFVSGYKS